MKRAVMIGVGILGLASVLVAQQLFAQQSGVQPQQLTTSVHARKHW